MAMGDKAYRNRVRGRKAQSGGAVLERWLEAQAEQIPNALLIKQHPSVKVLGNPRQPGNVIIDNKAWPDYIMLCHPRSMMFDAKRTGNKNRQKLKPQQLHQLHSLHTAYERGFPAFYVVYWDQRDVATAHPAKAISPNDPVLIFDEATVGSVKDDWFRDLFKKVQHDLNTNPEAWYAPDGENSLFYPL